MSKTIIDIKDHIYNINSELKPEFKKVCSVSALCSHIKQPFDEIAAATKCAESGKNNSYYKYYNMSVEDILKLWKEKSDTSKKYGALLDSYTGFITEPKSDDEFMVWKLDNNFEDDARLHNTCMGFDQFYSWITTATNYVFVGREIPMYINPNTEYKISGRLDALFYDPNNDAYIIFDYKTTDHISTGSAYRKKMNGPAYMLDDCDMNAYTVQLHLYKKALVETYHLTEYNKISVYVCNLLKEPNDKGLFYKLYPQNFKFDLELLNKIINFAVLKNKLLIKDKN